MPCPTCDHTMQKVGSREHEINVYHCPRCGTVKVEDCNDTDARCYPPKLVGRTRALLRWMRAHPARSVAGAIAEAMRLGVPESVDE